MQIEVVVTFPIIFGAHNDMLFIVKVNNLSPAEIESSVQGPSCFEIKLLYSYY